MQLGLCRLPGSRLQKSYLCVSTDTQDVTNQRHGVVRYCQDKKLLVPVFIEDTASGCTDWRAR